MAPGGLSEAFCGHFLAWARNWFQEASLELSGATFWLGLQQPAWSGLANVSRRPLWRPLRDSLASPIGFR
eukprot:8851448-Karenia_brevis.AAC.1